MNLIDACIDQGVKRVVALSTDKASSPANLYGASKLASDKLIIAAAHHTPQSSNLIFSCKIWKCNGFAWICDPFFLSIREKGPISSTDERMTRFMISLEEGVKLVWH